MRKPRKASWQDMGRYYGYPECCIEEFVNNFFIPSKTKEFKLKIGNRTGFVPCLAHAHEIKDGTIKLEDLINNRICSKPFPKG